VAGGYRAIDSMRLEKGYRVWAADITADESPYEAGLGFCVKKEGGFSGAEALGVGSAEGPAKPERRLRCLVLEDPRSVALGNEPVRIDGEITGRVTSGGYGYTVERSIAYAYLPAAIEIGTAVEVDIFGEWVAGEVAKEPLFDPKGERVRG
jgi:4-methylaminobutanoate oxidase (formaldehyde-forming)